MEDSKHRIIFALYLETWTYGESEKTTLLNNGQSVTPEEFDSYMKGKVFCPVCTTPLSRVPDITSIATNSRTAHFRHRRLYSEIECRLKTKAKEGLSYKNEEEANKAIEDGTLVIVSSWASEPPSYKEDNEGEDKEFSQTAIEDEDGPETEVAINRHTDREFTLPSKISSVTALCRNFDQNLNKGFLFPDEKYPNLLSDMLFDANRITEETDKKRRLYFGKIKGYQKLTIRGVITIFHKDFGRLKIYTNPEFDDRKHINHKSFGSYLIFHTSIEWEKEQLPKCYALEWGQYSLLPKQYEKLLNRIIEKTLK